ncbi:DUF4272 domain-containing protein [Campylobacter sp. faydin G-140]|uniref:DUF4272 domain-containing protein n=1 Tax=Campylobacter anatolicus TaxID=2829105 RepID=UPI001B911D6F|nr:DUF4272 domain-containing protein [Campylobacter anatolicus]MBR8462660.1 DUF4272 domain-containing protein [Campylobacter anatolicus]MBR8465772.1 DUF4272 domain-containing protein [Campylobacter anatolicus]
MKTAKQRRIESITRLKSENVPYFEQLPYLSDASQVKRRSVENIAKRAVTSLASIIMALSIDRGEYEETLEAIDAFIDKFGVRNKLTKQEKKILKNKATKQDIINATWKFESYWALVWALGFVDELKFPDTIIDIDVAISIVTQFNSMDELVAATKLRDVEQILDEADLIYRYHWACVDARINGRQAPQGLDESVVKERRAGLWWLVDMDEEDDWDNVAMDT